MTRTWHAGYLSSRDVYQIVGTPDDGSPPWVLEIDALLVIHLMNEHNAKGAGDAGKLLFRICARGAESGKTPAELLAMLRQLVHDQQQLMLQQQQAAYQHAMMNGYHGQQPMPPSFGQQIGPLGSQLSQNQLNNIALGLQQQAMGQFPNQGLGGFGQAPHPPDAALWDKPQKIETEMLAYRGWKLDLEYSGVTDDDRVACEIVLRSVSTTAKWPGPVLRADREPSPANENGIYAVGTDDRHNGNFNGYVAVSPVWGEVSLSGLVVEGHNGYRAEVCTIRRLWLNPTRDPVLPWALPDEALARVLARRYQVDTPTPLLPVFAVVQEMERARKDRDAMFTQATGSVVP